jgi:hypothetical protein
MELPRAKYYQCVDIAGAYVMYFIPLTYVASLKVLELEVAVLN